MYTGEHLNGCKEASVDRELIRGNIPALILALLAEGPSYAYQMSENLKKRTGGVISLLDGTLYNSLKQLEDLGLVRSYWEVQPNGRERRYYELLEEGHRELEARMAQWQEFQVAMNTILPARKG